MVAPVRSCSGGRNWNRTALSCLTARVLTSVETNGILGTFSRARVQDQNPAMTSKKSQGQQQQEQRRRQQQQQAPRPQPQRPPTPAPLPLPPLGLLLHLVWGDQRRADLASKALSSASKATWGLAEQPLRGPPGVPEKERSILKPPAAPTAGLRTLGGWFNSMGTGLGWPKYEPPTPLACASALVVPLGAIHGQKPAVLCMCDRARALVDHR